MAGGAVKNAELRQLALLCELIDTQCLNEAAARVHMSASAASQSLTRLRQALGDEVCVRDRNRYQLTPYGENALASFRHIVDTWREASSAGWWFDPQQCEQRLLIACEDGWGQVGLAAFYRDTLALAPRLRLDIDAPANGPRDIEALRAGTVDVVCTHQSAPTDARDLHAETLAQLPITLCCLRDDHPRIGDALSCAQYAAEEHLTVGTGRHADPAHDPIDRCLQALGLQARRRSAVPSWALCAELLVSTDRLVSASAEQAARLKQASPRIRVLPLPPELPNDPVPIYMLWHQRTHQSKPHRWLRQRLRAHFGDVPPV